jgi:SnoaL-like domain
MSAEENKALVHRFVEEFWNEGKTTAADELMAPDAQIHTPTGEVLNPDEFKIFVGTWRESFPDWYSTLVFHFRGADRGRGQGGGTVGAHTWASCRASLPLASALRGQVASSTASSAGRS